MGYAVLYHAKNPVGACIVEICVILTVLQFSFMDMISMSSRTNFFEHPNVDYRFPAVDDGDAMSDVL